MNGTGARSILAASLFCVVGGCSSSSTPANIKNVIGNYTVTVSNGVSTDDDLMSVRQGSAGTVLLTFTAGITTPNSGSDSTGLHATVDDKYALTMLAQPVNLDEATGNAAGTMSGTGKVSGAGYKTIALTLSFTPGAPVIPIAPDGGTPPDLASSPPIAGTAATLTIMGTKQ